MDLLKLITAGSVDDGKSTLIGRLLYDSKNILSDQLLQLEKQSKTNGAIDLALLTDGLRAEREQGITIDVAYRYFSTAKRKFILADAPGHVQYTRNMITGASNSDLIILLIDARHGVVEQTKRHSIITSLLRIPQIIVAINKMDLVDYSEVVFLKIVREYKKLAEQLELKNLQFIPISAVHGDNIVDASLNTDWYNGKPLLEILENIEVKNESHSFSRFPVQYVIRTSQDYRGYAGKITTGHYQRGNKIAVLPSGLVTRIEAIEINGKEVNEAFAPQSVVLRLEHDIDISRGDVIVKVNEQPEVKNEFDVLLAWMDQKTLQKGRTYFLQHNSTLVKAVVKEIDYRLDVNTLEQRRVDEEVSFNEIVKATIKTSSPIAFDPYKISRENGAAILIDETNYQTAGACIIQ